MMSAEEWAREQSQRWLDAQLDAIQKNREAYLADLKSRSDLELQRGAELAKALQAMNLPGRIQSIYGNAASDIGGLAQAFSGSLRDTATAEAANQQRMLSGTGQEGAVRNEGEAMGNVTYGLGGYIPARSLTEAGAAFGAQAALEPSFAARIGQDKASELYREGLGGLDEFSRAMNEVRTGQFDVEQELLSGRYDALNDARSSALKASDSAYKRLKDERDFLVKQAYLALAQGDRARSNEYLALAREKESRMANQAKGLDAEGNVLPGYTLDANGDVVKIDKKKTAAASTNRKKARQEREDEFLKMQQELPKDIADLAIEDKNPFTGATTRKLPSYQVAFRKLMEKYKYLLRYGTAGGQQKLRKRITDAIEAALAAEGIVRVLPPGTGRRT